jgi:hypothetical protein
MTRHERALLLELGRDSVEQWRKLADRMTIDAASHWCRDRSRVMEALVMEVEADDNARRLSDAIHGPKGAQ